MKQWSVALLLVSLMAGVAVWALPPEDPAAEPRFNEQKELLRPEGYREWIFVGATLGVSYSEKPQANPRFHNLYINPRAYREFKQTGRFPEGTMIVMENFTARQQSGINRQGHFEDEFAGVEAAVKDSSRFPESWAYFNFTRRGQPPAATAKAFPKQDCWSCHNEHGETDNVFTQFYPMLRRGK
jgi:hypothetical protein